MTSRRKNLLTYFLVFLVPMLFLTVVNYWYTSATVNSTVGNLAQDNLNNLIGDLDDHLQESEKQMTRLSLSRSLQEYVKRRLNETNPSLALTTRTNDRSVSRTNDLPEELRLSFASALNGRQYWQRITLYARDRLLPLMQAERNEDAASEGPTFRLGNFSPAGFDKTVLLSGKNSVRVSGSKLQCTVPVLDKDQAASSMLAAEGNLTDIVSDVASALETEADSTTNARTIVVVVDRNGTILYHSNHVLQGQTVTDATPEFAPLVTAATSNQGGAKTFQSNDGQEYATAFAPFPKLGIAVALGRTRSKTFPNAKWWLLFDIGISALTATLGTVLLERYAQKRSQGMARVTEDLSAIAKGELDRRIELRSSDDARGLADNINVVTERLRTQIAREAESRQFESFVRLSAMLTHDLKNAIEALSLTVGNMERHFDNEQFRADAMKSVAGATDKLKAVVARLSRPLTSFSGEHKRPAKCDLVPMLKRTVDATAGPLAYKHSIKVELPDRLMAVVSADRIEAVVENLIINALEAMGERSGTLTIKGAKLDDNWVTFSVSDTGSGMSRSFIEERLFRPFSTTKRRGIGLGLYTCRETVKADGGSIEVESIEGTGTTFRVVLPSASSEGRN